MAETINFYEGAMGMKLRAVYPMHGIRGAKHCFLEAGNGNEISFVEFTDPKQTQVRQSREGQSQPSATSEWPFLARRQQAAGSRQQAAGSDEQQQLLVSSPGAVVCYLCHGVVRCFGC